LIFCPRIADLRPFNISDEHAIYWNLRLSALSNGFKKLDQREGVKKQALLESNGAVAAV
jgi:hypothetical protein